MSLIDTGLLASLLHARDADWPFHQPPLNQHAGVQVEHLGMVVNVVHRLVMLVEHGINLLHQGPHTPGQDGREEPYRRNHKDATEVDVV